MLEKMGLYSIMKDSPDVSVKKIRKATNKYLISTIDFFYPIVQDPYNQGRIACCNVLSDLYAMGVEKIDKILMVLCISLLMNPKEQEVITSLMLKGFTECAKEAGTHIEGGQTIFNPWPLIGGVAIAGVDKSEFLMPQYASPGDILVCTKALGTQIAANAYQQISSESNCLKNSKAWLNFKQIKDLYLSAQTQMTTLNLLGAKLLKKYKSKACTDITGFGLLGHAQNLVAVQKKKVDFIIHTLPILKNCLQLDQLITKYKLLEGFSAETSGGLLAAFHPKDAQSFIKEMRRSGQIANEIGYVKEGQNEAKIIKKPKIIEI